MSSPSLCSADPAQIQVSTQAPALNWYLAYTKPKQEHIAEQHLGRQGYQTYLPLYKQYQSRKGRGQSADHAGVVYQPMFPRYVFFQPGSPRQGLSAARSTRGVSTLVSFGQGPAALDIGLIEQIRQAERERARAELATISPYQPGAQVRLRGHGMKGLIGLVLAVTNQRVTMLLDFLGRQQIVDVDHAMIELA